MVTMRKNNIEITGEGVQELKMMPTKDHILGIDVVHYDNTSHTSTSVDTLSLAGDDNSSSQSSHQSGSTLSESSSSVSSGSTHASANSTSSNRRSHRQQKTSSRKEFDDKDSSSNRLKGRRHDSVRNLPAPERIQKRMLKSCSQRTDLSAPTTESQDGSFRTCSSSWKKSLTGDKEEEYDDETVESKDVITVESEGVVVAESKDALKPLSLDRKVLNDASSRVNEKLNRLKKDRKSLENSFRHLYKGEMVQLEQFKPCNQKCNVQLRDELATAKKRISQLEINRAYEQFQLRNELSKALQEGKKKSDKATDVTHTNEVTSNPSEEEGLDNIYQLKASLKQAWLRELSLRDDFQAYKDETATTISMFVEKKRLLSETQEANEDLLARNADLEEQVRRLTAEIDVLKGSVATNDTSDASSTTSNSSEAVDTQDALLQEAFERKKRTSESSTLRQKWLR